MVDRLKVHHQDLYILTEPTGQAALELLASEQVNAVLVSAALSDMPAEELTRRIAQRPADTHPKLAVRSPADDDGIAAVLNDWRPTLGEGHRPDMQHKWGVLKERFRHLSAERLAVLGQVRTAMSRQAVSATLREEGVRTAHSIAGSAAMFGYPKSTEIAREIELLLSQGSAALQAERYPLLLDELCHDLYFPAGESRSPSYLPPEGAVTAAAIATPPPQVTVLYAGAQDALLRTVAESRRVSLLPVASKAQAELVLLEQRIDAAIIDVDLPGGVGAAIDLIVAIQDWPRTIPIAVLTASGHVDQQRRVMQLGVDRLLCKPVAPADIIEAITGLCGQGNGDRPTILAVDDDPIVLGALAEIVADMAVNFVACADPQRFWQSLEQCDPALILFDVNMPTIGGIALCRQLRNRPQYQATPVIFLTASTSEDSLTETFAAGADDFVRKPIVRVELVARIKARLERHRLLHQLTDTDPLTGAVNRRKFLTVWDRHRLVADQKQFPISLAFLDLDHFKQVNDTHGHGVGDSVLMRVVAALRQHVRPGDVVARWGGEEFAILLCGIGKDRAVDQLNAVLAVLHADEQLGAGQLSFSGGVSEYPRDHTEFGELYRMADDALYRAKAMGRARVLAAQSDGPAAEPVAVVVVADDDGIAADLQAVVHRGGWQSRRFHDGESAAHELVGAAPRLVAGLVIVAVHNPGMDGLSFLQTLKEHDVTRSTRVLLMASRPSQAELRVGLCAGAFGYIDLQAEPGQWLKLIGRALHG